MDEADNLCISSRAESAASLEEFAQKIADSAARLPQIEDGTPEQIRAWRKERGNPFAPSPRVMHKTEDLIVPLSRGQVQVRHYIPENAELASAACCIYFHGGGFVLGDVDEYDTLTQHLAANSGCHVLSVDYELAPTSKVKQIHQDGLEVYRWVREHGTDLGIDPDRIALAGDSAGGNLTAAVTLACKREDIPQPRFQVLIYPSVDLAMEFQSVEEFAEGHFLTKAGMSWFRGHYLESPDQGLDPELRFLSQDLVGLSPAMVITAGFDPLRDEGKAYADKLEESGVRVEHICYTDQIHAFLSFAGGIRAGDDALRRIGTALRTELA